jgi:hypothetical protein
MESLQGQPEPAVRRVPPVAVERVAVEGSCPECGSPRLQAYPVVGEIGWEEVVKCQGCLHSVSRTPWRRLGPLELLVDLLDSR